MNSRRLLKRCILAFFTVTTCFIVGALMNKKSNLHAMMNKKEDTNDNKQPCCEMKDAMPNSIDQLSARLDRVNRWIENCDQKVYIMLAFIGACITVFFSSSMFFKARAVLIQPFYAFLKHSDAYCIDFRKILLFVGLITISIFVGRMIYFLIKALTPKTITKEFLKKNPSLEGKSLLHFQTIAGMTFDDFESYADNDTKERYKHDLYSQIYINSSICDAKFENLKKGLQAMNYLLIFIPLEAALAFFLP